MNPGVKVQTATEPAGLTMRVISVHQEGWSNQCAAVPAVTRSTEEEGMKGREEAMEVWYWVKGGAGFGEDAEEMFRGSRGKTELTWTLGREGAASYMEEATSTPTTVLKEGAS